MVSSATGPYHLVLMDSKEQMKVACFVNQGSMGSLWTNNLKGCILYLPLGSLLDSYGFWEECYSPLLGNFISTHVHITDR